MQGLITMNAQKSGRKGTMRGQRKSLRLSAKWKEWRKLAGSMDGDMKRFRTPVAKENELLVKYGKEYGDEDLFYCYPENECGMKRDSKMMMIAFERTVLFQEDGRTLRQELEARGYDITTLKFSIMKRVIK